MFMNVWQRIRPIITFMQIRTRSIYLSISVEPIQYSSSCSRLRRSTRQSPNKPIKEIYIYCTRSTPKNGFDNEAVHILTNPSQRLKLFLRSALHPYYSFLTLRFPHRQRFLHRQRLFQLRFLPRIPFRCQLVRSLRLLPLPRLPTYADPAF